MIRTWGVRALAVALCALGAGCASSRSADAPAAAPAANLTRTTLAADSATVVSLLGGTRNAACPLPGVGTGGQPDSSRLRRLASSGFRAVIDLRMPEEPRGYDEPAVARAAGLEYVALPVSPATLTDSTFDSFRALMTDPARTPVLVHCASGNRVGALLLPWLLLDRGWPLERALASTEAGGLHSATLREMALDYAKRHRSD